MHRTTAEALSRRHWLQQASALAAGALLPVSAPWARNAPSSTPRVLTAWNTGHQSWAGLWMPGARPRAVALPARAHQLLVLPGMPRSNSLRGPQALVMARRPGEYLLRMDPVRGSALHWHTMEDDRYLGGHAVLAPDGRTFFTTETDAATGAGLVAERDLRSLQKLREFPSGGIGPHALLLEPDGNLLVANGGILNLPETGRRKLNIGRMDPNLSRLQVRSGTLITQYRLPDPLLSLRHLALAPDGTVGAALQAEHPDRQDRHRAPALALLKGEQLHAVPWPIHPTVSAAWDGYAGDICHAGARFWVSAPHAGLLLAWNAEGELLSTQSLPGVGALASGGSRLVAGGDRAALLFPAPDAPPVVRSISTPWDNHAALLADTVV